MKITKRQLRRIIREERTRLQEIVPPPPAGMYPEDEPPEEIQQWRDQRANVDAIESDAIDMLNDILDDWDNDPKMSAGDKYYNRIVGVTKLLER
jgi:hypothetical protein